MTPDEQRIAMAEITGQDRDYGNDLNAMFMADKWAREVGMNADQWEAYGKALYDAHSTAHIRNPDGTLDFYDLASLLTELTAAQRREAFLRTIGKWKE